jgi:N4-gp56 family major capsid protein
MAGTLIPWGHPSAQKKWSAVLSNDIRRRGYFKRRFMGKGENNIIEEKTEIKEDAGDRVSFDLSVKIRQEPTEGDARLKGKEEQLRFYYDEVIIDQSRHSVSAGGRMSRKRTVHDMRKIGKSKLQEYWAAFEDEVMFAYLSGARGVNAEFIVTTAWTGRAGNPLQAPDAAHILFGGDATQKSEIVAADTMTKQLVERANTHAKMIREYDPDAQEMAPVDIDGGAHFVIVMSEFQAYDLRQETGVVGWADIAKAAAGAEGRNSPIFKGGLGMIDNTVLHSHGNVIRFSDYGVGVNLPASRALFMGRQAGVIAYGTPKGMRYMWQEELEDFGNEPTIAGGAIWGFKKTRFNGKDFGVIAIDTYAKNPRLG